MTALSGRLTQYLGAMAAIAAIQVWSPVAHATLGADVTSVESDRQQMKGQLRVTSAVGYAVHEIQTPTGTVVREYITAAGRVFAVSWRGPMMPDLRQTLGDSFQQYEDAARAPHALRRQLNIDHADLVVRSGGRMRAYSGYAYLPALMPQGFTADDIK